MITVPTDSWYTGWFGGHCVGPFNLKGQVAITDIPSPEFSEFEERKGLMGQNFVAHRKTHLKATLDGFSINGDRRDEVLDTASYPAWSRFSRIYFPSGHSQIAVFNGLPDGSYRHTLPDKAMVMSDHYPTEEGLKTVTVMITPRPNRTPWFVRSEMIVGCDGPIVASTSNPNIGYTRSFRKSRSHSRSLLQGEYISSFEHLSEFAVDEMPTWSFSRVDGSVMYRRAGLTVPDVSEHHLQALATKFRDEVPWVGEHLQPYGDLSQKSLDNLTVIDSNLLEALAELTSLKSLVKSLADLPKWVSSKKLAGDYLSVKWGLLPMIDDLTQIWESFSAVAPTINNFGLVPCTGTDQVMIEWSYLGYPVQCTATRRAHLYILPDENLRSLTQWLRNHGLFPSLENAWNLIPFAFVVDWFANVARYLESLDSNTRFGELTIAACVYSEKTTHTTSYYIEKWGQVELTYSAYDRIPMKEPIYPSYIFQSSDFTLHKRWLEAGALIMQLKKN